MTRLIDAINEGVERWGAAQLVGILPSAQTHTLSTIRAWITPAERELETDGWKDGRLAFRMKDAFAFGGKPGEELEIELLDLGDANALHSFLTAAMNPATYALARGEEEDDRA